MEFVDVLEAGEEGVAYPSILLQIGILILVFLPHPVDFLLLVNEALEYSFDVAEGLDADVHEAVLLTPIIYQPYLVICQVHPIFLHLCVLNLGLGLLRYLIRHSLLNFSVFLAFIQGFVFSWRWLVSGFGGTF